MSLLAAVSFTVDGSANEQNVRLIATFPDCAEAARVRRTKERRKRPVGEFLGDADGLTDSCNKGCDVVWIGRKGGRMKNEWKELER